MNNQKDAVTDNPEDLKDKKVNIVLLIVSLITIFDCSISFIATVRQNERRHNIPSKNIVDKFLDKHYPDELMNSVYNNAVPVEEKMDK